MTQFKNCCYKGAYVACILENLLQYFSAFFRFDSADDDAEGRSWQFSGDTGSSGFGDSVTSFISWTDVCTKIYVISGHLYAYVNCFLRH